MGPRTRHLLLALAALLLASCAGRTTPPPGASGPEIYAAQRCDVCHGDEAEGGRGGPPLVGLAERWTAADLAEFFVEPGQYVQARPALRATMGNYLTPMGAYGDLAAEHRLALGEWLLTR